MPLKLKEIILTPSEDMSYPRISEGSLTRVRDRDPIACPVGVPLPLWSALQQNYNSSQMRAISSICLHNGDKQGSNLMQSNFPFLLLQGPPGTGHFL